MTREQQTSKERLASLIDVIDTRLKNTAPAHALIAPDDWRLLKPLLLAGLSTRDVKSDAASWLEEMHDYARPVDQPKLLEAAALLRAAHEPGNVPSADQLTGPDVWTCPRCGSLNPAGTAECYHCKTPPSEVERLRRENARLQSIVTMRELVGAAPPPGRDELLDVIARAGRYIIKDQPGNALRELRKALDAASRPTKGGEHG